MGLQQSQGQPRTIAVSFHHSGMPPHILRLFEAPAAPPLMKLPRRRKPELPYTGLAGYMQYFDGGGGGQGLGKVGGEEPGVPPLPPLSDEVREVKEVQEETGGKVGEDLDGIVDRLKGKKVAELKEELKEAGLSVTGNKGELVDRLATHYQDTAVQVVEEEEAGAAPPPLPPMDEGELPPPLPDDGEILPDDGEILPDAEKQGQAEGYLLPASLPEEPKGLFLNKEMAYQVRIGRPTKLEGMILALKEKQRLNELANEEGLKLWNPHIDPNVEGDPLCTLFVGGLSEDVSERKLQREFESYGPIKRVRVVHDRISGKSKGYGFVEFESADDMKEAFKQAYGQRIEGKRCLVDVERGRTVPGWKPKRLGGGASAGKRTLYMLPKNWKKAQLTKLAFEEMGMEVRDSRSSDRGFGSKPGFGGGDRGDRYGSGGFQNRDHRGMYRRDDRRDDRRGDRGYGGGRRDNSRDDRHRGYGGRDDRDDRRGGYGDRGGGYGDRGDGYADRGGGYRDRGDGYGDRGGGYRDRGEHGDRGGYADRRSGDRRRDRDERDRFDDRHRRDDRRRDDRDRYEYRDPKRERISYDDFAAPVAPAPTGGDHEEGEI
jgi:U1 small nuclear ribonucleoprotein